MNEQEQIIDNFHKFMYNMVRKANRNIKYPDPEVENHIERHLYDVFGKDTENLHKQYHKNNPHLKY